jgi:3-oxoacyl-[acyl-carrier protein] reductase
MWSEHMSDVIDEQGPESAAPPVALVTGSGRGIGRAIARVLAADGWRVTLNYRRDAASAAETLALIRSAGGTAIAVQADIALAGDRERLLNETLAAYGQIDVLVNNAGMAPRRRVDLLELGEESYDEVLAANLKGPFFLTQVVARRMLAQLAASPVQPSRAPLIVNIGSMSAYTSSVDRAEYCLSKAGVAMMTRLFADRLAAHGINVYEIRPGIIRTDMTRPAQEKYDRRIAEGLTPIPRWGEPEDVAAAVLAIAQGRFPFSTGEVINVDGGLHLQRL